MAIGRNIRRITHTVLVNINRIVTFRMVVYKKKLLSWWTYDFLGLAFLKIYATILARIMKTHLRLCNNDERYAFFKEVP
jgi:hypothetical protein